MKYLSHYRNIRLLAEQFSFLKKSIFNFDRKPTDMLKGISGVQRRDPCRRAPKVNKLPGGYFLGGAAPLGSVPFCQQPSLV